MQPLVIIILTLDEEVNIAKAIASVAGLAPVPGLCFKENIAQQLRHLVGGKFPLFGFAKWLEGAEETLHR